MFSLLAALFLYSEAWAYDINVYDSPSDKTKVVVEVCESVCHKLITDKKTLAQDYAKIEEWALKVTGQDR